jgi:hypothetical protein
VLFVVGAVHSGDFLRKWGNFYCGVREIEDDRAAGAHVASV